MGIIAVLLYSQGLLGAKFYVPFWVVIACQIAMAAGTMAGGWRIVQNHGLEDHAADADAGRLRGNRRLRHAVFGDLARHPGVHHAYRSPARSSASARRKKLSAVRWAVAKEIVTAWIITIPASGCWPRCFTG